MPTKTLILGGIRSGKSVLAEQQAITSKKQVVYLATAQAFDDEMHQRISLHIERRPQHWINIEEPIKLADALQTYNQSENCILIDCISGWLTNLLMAEDEQLLHLQLTNFTRAVDNCSAELIMVSTESNLGIIPLGDLTRRYCDEIGLLHQTLAQHCDSVILTVAGLPHFLKGDKLE